MGEGEQWRLTNHRLCLFLERCCMGVVCQIIDLDNSSSPPFTVNRSPLTVIRSESKIPAVGILDILDILRGDGAHLLLRNTL